MVDGVADLHCHLLPELDDGAPDLDTAIAMARRAVDEGITIAVATPHTFDGVYDVDRTAAHAACARLREALTAAGVALDVRVAAELRLDVRIPGAVAEDPTLSLDGRGRYVLLELPHHAAPPDLARFLFELRVRGTTPVIAHPERNLAVRDDPSIVADWVRHGALTQLTGASLTGAFGAPIQACTNRLLELGLGHLVATDAHRADRRPPMVGAAFAAAVAVVGEAGARALFHDNPLRVLSGEAPATIAAPTARASRADGPRGRR
jgi:protein-tyrosine phosphatase